MNYIICTNLIKEKIGKNNIYLGTWALPDSKILLYKQKKINKFIWNNKKQFIKDSLYIKKICLKLYHFFYLNLNKTHQSNFSIKFWKILLFPWLYYYISALYFQWNCIKKIKKNNTFIFKKDLNKTIINYLENHSLLIDDHWNQKSFQEIIIFQKKKYIFQKELSKKNYFLYNEFFFIKLFLFFFPTFVFKILNYFISLSKINNVLFIDTAYSENSSFPLFQKYKLKIYFKYLLNKLNPLFVKSGLSERSKRNIFKYLFLKSYSCKDKFEIFLKNKISDDMPNYLLEDFKNYLNRNIKLNDSKIIISAYSLHSIFSNKFYIAEQVNKGAKLYLMEHGGSLPCKKEELGLDLDIVDKKITWYKPLYSKHFQLPTHPFYFNKLINQNTNYKTNQDCIFIGPGDYKYIWNSTYNLKPPQLIEKLDNIKKLYNFLPNNIKIRTFIKPHEGYTHESSHDLIKFYKKIFNKKIIRNRSLEDCIVNSKLVICTYPETTFAISMYSFVPTILIYNRNHYIFHKKANSLIKKLIEHKIIFFDPKIAALHINKVWDNPWTWYNSTEVKKARNLFLKTALGIKFPRDFKEEIKKWNSILK
jgi:putative transferase (TIGR04331 family)